MQNAWRNWATAEMSWGIWDVPETEVGVIGDVARLDVVELGCGTAYSSAWLARAGARPTAVVLAGSGRTASAALLWSILLWARPVRGARCG